MKSDISISLITFAYNEEILIEGQIRKWMGKLGDRFDDFEVILVNDGSTDKTGAIADTLQKEFPALKVIHHPENRGVGHAARTGRVHVTKDYVFWNDIDEHFSLDDLDRIIPLLGRHDIVVGYKDDHLVKGAFTFNWIKSRVNYYLIKTLFMSPINDFQFVQFYPAKFFRDCIELESYSSFIPAECLIKAKSIGLSIAQVPLFYHTRYNDARPTKCSNISTIMTSVKNIFSFWLGWYFGGARSRAHGYWKDKTNGGCPWRK